MEPKVYQSIIRRHSRIPPAARLKAYLLAAYEPKPHPFSSYERKVSDKLVAGASAVQTWYHGGLAGRAVGDMLLPSSLVGLNPRKLDVWSPKEQVYITRYRDAAQGFTDLNERFDERSQVYVVEPVGPLIADPEALRTGLLIQADPQLWRQMQAHVGDFFGRFCCESAKVVRVLERQEPTLGKLAQVR